MSRWQPPTLHQPKNGYRFAVDAFLIAALACRFQPKRWLDLGTGSGPIAWFLHRHLPHSHGVAVERQPELMAFAHRNLETNRVLLIEGDLRNIPWRDQAFDVVVCNPPFFPLGSGRLSPDATKARAHHALFGSMLAFAKSVRDALHENGHLCCLIRQPDEARIERALIDDGWSLAQEILVLPKPGAAIIRKLCAFQKGMHIPASVQSESLILKTENGDDTSQLIAWLSPNIAQC
jgi:tRNA1(Val) A37 N6-methylase TrmN6